MKKFGLIGSPIKNSISPLIHNKIMKMNNVEGTYELIETKEIPSKDFLRIFNGLNVTTPLKEDILKIADNKDISVEMTGAANTVVIDGKLTLFNTDFTALVDLMEANKLKPGKALVIGAGGAARAAIAALKSIRSQNIDLQNRSQDRASEVASFFGINVDISKDYDVIINAIKPEGKEFLLKIVKNVNFKFFIDFNYLTEDPLTKIAKIRRIQGISGKEILIAQAVRSQEIWNRKNMFFEWKEEFD